MYLKMSVSSIPIQKFKHLSLKNLFSYTIEKNSVTCHFLYSAMLEQCFRISLLLEVIVTTNKQNYFLITMLRTSQLVCYDLGPQSLPSSKLAHNQCPSGQNFMERNALKKMKLQTCCLPVVNI